MPEEESSCGGDGGDSCDISAGYGVGVNKAVIGKV
jgi:hypothetical protein